MFRVRLLLVSLVLAGCTSAAATPSVAPTASAEPTASAGAPAASTVCIDAGQSGDLGESIVVALQGVDTALKAQNATQARAGATTAVAALEKFADLVDPVEPAAAKEIRTAVADLDTAKAQFPAGLALVTQAEAAWDQGLKDAEVGNCPS